MNDPQQSVRRIFEFFAEICKVPHPSYHCDNMREFLKHTAVTRNLQYREDDAGNIRIDRKNADYSQAVALQAHMEMVPQSTEIDFDFTTQAIEFEEIGSVLRSKGQKTTLGADNGIGMATALAAMLDEDLKDIPLCAIFTVDEEVGMIGARNINKEFLDCRAIFNLDSETWGDIIIGCAGGTRINTYIPLTKQKTPSGCSCGIKVYCKGLKGGHSGVDIHLNRGNAILILLDFISESSVYVSSLRGGTLPNAIPRDAEFTGAVQNIEELKKFAAEYSLKIRKTFDTFDDFEIVIEELENIPEYCIENFGQTARFITNAQYGVIAVAEDYGCVATSNNLAIAEGGCDFLRLVMSLRSIFNQDKAALTRSVAEYFTRIGGKNEIIEGCPAWESSNPPEFLKMLSDTFNELFNTSPEIKYIHAGLECGLFGSVKPDIPIISFGPTIRFPHSPSEELELATLKDFYIFLANILQKLLKK